MWTTDSIWLEVSIVSFIFVLGNIFFGHFEEQTPKIKRLLKYFLTLLVIISLASFFGRTVALIVLGLSLIPVFYIHIIMLPKKGINGWTGEPKERYYEYRGWNKSKLYRAKQTES